VLIWIKKRTQSANCTALGSFGAILRRIETHSVVSHRELQPAVQPPQSNVRPAGCSVTCDIAQALLDNTKKTESYVVWHLVGDFISGQINAERGCLGKMFALGLQRLA
jgi:hypothetical protein